MSSPAREIAEYLEDQGVGVFGGDTDWSLHVYRQPDEPDRCVTLYDTGGAPPIVVDESDDEGVDTDLRAPSIQVRARGRTHDETRARLEIIHRLLTIPRERDIGEGRYVAINASSDILDAGFDERDRYEMTANFDIIRQALEEVT